MTERLWLTQINLWSIEVAPFLPLSGLACLSHSLNDAGMTLPEHTTNSPSCRKPIDIGKSDAHDDHDAHDDESQRFSRGGAALQCSALRQGSSRGGM